MNPDTLKLWLRKKKTSGLVLGCLLGLLAFCSGIVILFLTFWLTYGIIWFGGFGISALSELFGGGKVHISHNIRWGCGALFVVLLFVQHFRTSPSYWGEYPDRDYVAAPGLQAASGLLGGLATMLAYPGASANMVADILLTGPRLVTGSFKMVAQGFRIRRLDEEGCSQLLALLYTRVHCVQYDELTAAGWDAWFGQLRCIEGVEFLQKGLMLSGDLRNELNALRED